MFRFIALRATKRLNAFRINSAMNCNHFAAIVLSIAVLTLSVASADVYSGEPLDEALHDLVSSGLLVSHELSSASGLLRTDVFRLKDGRLVAVTSRAKKFGELYTVETLRVTPSSTAKLTKRLPTVELVKF